MDVVLPQRRLWLGDPFVWLNRWRKTASDRVRDGSGNRIRCASCPCGADPCTYCADCTPEQFQLVVSSVSVKTNCCSYGGHYWKFSASPNATYYLDQHAPNACCWCYAGSFTGTWYRYSDSGCTTQTATGSLQPVVELEKNSSTRFLVKVGAVPSASDYSTYGTPGAFFFLDDKTVSSNCDVTFSFTSNNINLYTCSYTGWSQCSYITSLYYGSGGSVAVTSQGC